MAPFGIFTQPSTKTRQWIDLLETGAIPDEAKRWEGPGSDDGEEDVLALIGRAVFADQRLKGRIADAKERLRAKANEPPARGSHGLPQWTADPARLNSLQSQFLAGIT